jgi:hypothetical protein
MGRATGEIKEYLKYAKRSSKVTTSSEKAWFLSLQKYMREWVEEHKELKTDTWTSDRRALNENGVWK